MLNQKRAHLRSLEERFRIVILVNADHTIGGQVSFVIEKGEQVHSPEQARALAMLAPPVAIEVEEEEVVPEEADTEDEDAQDEAKDDEPVSESEGEMAEAQAEAQAEERPEGENGNGRKRRRRRGRRGERRDEGAQVAREPSDEHPIAPGGDDEEDATGTEAEAGEPVEAAENGAENGGETNGDGERRRRRRGRRGGRRNRRERDGETVATGPENGHADEAEPEAAGALETSAVEFGHRVGGDGCRGSAVSA